MIAIVDYKAGNLTSVQRALEFLGHQVAKSPIAPSVSSPPIA